jgi:hypothetical protein
LFRFVQPSAWLTSCRAEPDRGQPFHQGPPGYGGRMRRRLRPDWRGKGLRWPAASLRDRYIYMYTLSWLVCQAPKRAGRTSLENAARRLTRSQRRQRPAGWGCVSRNGDAPIRVVVAGVQGNAMHCVARGRVK